MLIYLFNQSIIYLFTNFAKRPGTLKEQAPLHSISVWLYIMVWNTTFRRIIEGGDYSREAIISDITCLSKYFVLLSH